LGNLCVPTFENHCAGTSVELIGFVRETTVAFASQSRFIVMVSRSTKPR